MRLLFFLSLLLALPVHAGSLGALSLPELFTRQEQLEKQAGSLGELTEVNRWIAEKSREALQSKGYRVGEVLKEAGDNPNFYFSLEAGPQDSRIGKVVEAASRQFGIGYRLQVGGLHYGSYSDSERVVRLSPKFQLLPETGMFNTLLHETRHAFFWHLAEKGVLSPLNIDVVALGETDLTGVDLYKNYVHYQELETHVRDFHQIRSGVTTNYLLDGYTQEGAAVMKAEKVIKFSDAIHTHSQAAIDSLTSGLAASGPLERNTEISKAGMVLVVPVRKAGASGPYANVRILLPGIKPGDSDEKVRRTAISQLKASMDRAGKRKTAAVKELADFRRNPRIGPPRCRELYQAMGGGM